MENPSPIHVRINNFMILVGNTSGAHSNNNSIPCVEGELQLQPLPPKNIIKPYAATYTCNPDTVGKYLTIFLPGQSRTLNLGEVYIY